MRDVALEIPLRAFPLAGSGQGDHATNARIQALGNSFDNAPLSGCIAPFKYDHDLELLVNHPVLELHKLPLQSKKFVKINPPLDRFRAGPVRDPLQQVGQADIVRRERDGRGRPGSCARSRP